MRRPARTTRSVLVLSGVTGWKRFVTTRAGCCLCADRGQNGTARGPSHGPEQAPRPRRDVAPIRASLPSGHEGPAVSWHPVAAYRDLSPGRAMAWQATGTPPQSPSKKLMTRYWYYYILRKFSSMRRHECANSSLSWSLRMMARPAQAKTGCTACTPVIRADCRRLATPRSVRVGHPDQGKAGTSCQRRARPGKDRVPAATGPGQTPALTLTHGPPVYL